MTDKRPIEGGIGLEKLQLHEKEISEVESAKKVAKFDKNSQNETNIVNSTGSDLNNTTKDPSYESNTVSGFSESGQQPVESEKSASKKTKKAKKANKTEKSAPKEPVRDFIERLMVPIPGITPSKDLLPLKIMTYNVLAQSLVKRTLFPTSGFALKWAWRSKTLISEISLYNPDVICLQEVDDQYWNPFWRKQFQTLGYEYQFSKSPTKAHGICIAFKSDLFVYKNRTVFEYDNHPSDSTRSVLTGNVGMLVCLQFQPHILQKYPYLSNKNGIIFGTTHLYWHPRGCFERTRQLYIMLEKYKEFTHLMNVVLGEEKEYYSFLAGDLNSEPFDYPYLSLTAKPVKYQGEGYQNLQWSIMHLDGETIEEEDVESEPNCSPRQLEEIQLLENAHNKLDLRAISLYSLGYLQIHPENSGIKNDRNEPGFSNWAHAWRGLLDYILIVAKWDGTQDFSTRVDSIEEVHSNEGIKLLSLLRMPSYEEMGPEPSGQPRVGQYPSDHLCMMAEVQLT